MGLTWFLLGVPDDLASAHDFERANPGFGSCSNTVARSLVKLFIQALVQNHLKAIVVFNVLVLAAQSQELPSSSRLVSFSLLIRLRSDQTSRLLILGDPDHQGLPAAMYRTERSSPTIHDKETGFLPLEKSDSRNARVSGLSGKSSVVMRNAPRTFTRGDQPIKAKLPFGSTLGYPGSQLLRLTQVAPI